MSSENNIKVNIFGTEYPLRVNANVEYVKRIAEYVDSKMREVQAAKPNRPVHQIAILAALNITDELLHQKEVQKKRHINFEEKVKSLTDKLEFGIKDDPGSGGFYYVILPERDRVIINPVVEARPLCQDAQIPHWVKMKECLDMKPWTCTCTGFFSLEGR